ncbi:uncharacterized protein LOC135470849 [Liolophura sinensis]|uniref:uncharacterized protein LOC135470849 n=1 Tax=Liolophura sinensis TaxID=3198878 RepID=UPI003158791F
MMRSSPTYIVLMNLAVADVFTLVVAPSALLYTHFMDELTESTYPILIVLSSLSLVNSIFNPIMYFFLSRRNVSPCVKCRK